MPTFIGFCFEGTPKGKKFKIGGVRVWGHLKIGGVRVWEYKWRRKGVKVDVIDPAYKAKHKFDVFSIVTKNGEMEFIAGEFSYGCWGFYKVD